MCFCSVSVWEENLKLPFNVLLVSFVFGKLWSIHYSPFSSTYTYSGEEAVELSIRPTGGAPPAHPSASHCRCPEPQTSPSYCPQSRPTRTKLPTSFSFNKKTDHTQHPDTDQHWPPSLLRSFVLFFFSICYHCDYIFSSKLHPSCHCSISASSSGGCSEATVFNPTGSESAPTSSTTPGSPQAASKSSCLPSEVLPALCPCIGSADRAEVADRARAFYSGGPKPDALPKPASSSDGGCWPEGPFSRTQRELINDFQWNSGSAGV